MIRAGGVPTPFGDVSGDRGGVHHRRTGAALWGHESTAAAAGALPDGHPDGPGRRGDVQQCVKVVNPAGPNLTGARRLASEANLKPPFG